MIRSVPAGATVTIDGTDRGRTPLTVGGLAPGAHRLRLTRDGYVTENQRIDVPRSRNPRAVRVTLRRVAAAPPARAATGTPNRAPVAASPTFGGMIEVQSLPTGAQVFLDGKRVGSTPISTLAARAGEHVLRLERDGYRRWTSSIRVVAGQRTRVTASLER
jgi:hypothetical protein